MDEELKTVTPSGSRFLRLSLRRADGYAKLLHEDHREQLHSKTRMLTLDYIQMRGLDWFLNDQVPE